MTTVKFEDAGVNLDDPEVRARSPQYVLENILGSMCGMMEAHLKAPDKKKRPSPEGYAKILIGDLTARGFEIREVGR